MEDSDNELSNSSNSSTASTSSTDSSSDSTTSSSKLVKQDEDSHESESRSSENSDSCHSSLNSNSESVQKRRLLMLRGTENTESKNISTNPPSCLASLGSEEGSDDFQNNFLSDCTSEDAFEGFTSPVISRRKKMFHIPTVRSSLDSVAVKSNAESTSSSSEEEVEDDSDSDCVSSTSSNSSESKVDSEPDKLNENTVGKRMSTEGPENKKSTPVARESSDKVTKTQETFNSESLLVTSQNFCSESNSRLVPNVDALNALADTALRLMSSEDSNVQPDHSTKSVTIERRVNENNSPSLERSGIQIDADEDAMMPMPIQAEVVMSDDSDSDQMDMQDNVVSDTTPVDADNSNTQNSSALILNDMNDQFSNYIRKFVGAGDNIGDAAELLQYHPSNNSLPNPPPNLSQWQLDHVQLPTFTPTQSTPDWIRLTIPPDGYPCLSCGDTFYLESSKDSHLHRRSILITLECGPCDAKLTFYNKCLLREHLREHMEQGLDVGEDSIEVKSLPLHMTPLLQPYMVPVPKASALQCSKGAGNSSGGADVNGVRSFRCYMCERVFSSARLLMAHMRTDQLHSDRRVECRKCQLVLPSVCAAKAHILTHPPANPANISVCPECGVCCHTPREFVHHINSCGHQLRRSGIICGACQLCFFRSEEDFLAHWTKDHCSKSYECVVCNKLFESLVFHSCSSPGQQVLSTFRCVLACPLCDKSVFSNSLEPEVIHADVRKHLESEHSRTINRVFYVFKSKFCSNAFRSKDELRAHHDREHRRENHYRSKSCSLHHTVVAAQNKFSIANDVRGSDQRLSLITIPILLSEKEKQEANAREVPTVSSIWDKNLFPDLPTENLINNSNLQHRFTIIDGMKVNASTGEVVGGIVLGRSSQSNGCSLDSQSPYVCYRCGMTHTERKKHKRHVRNCSGEVRDRICRICQNSFRGENFVLHCRYHMQQGIVLCMLCNATQFESVEQLHRHFERHAHEQFVYPAVCPFCGITLPDVPTSLTHLQEKHAFLMGNGSELSGVSSTVQLPNSSSFLSTGYPPSEPTVTCERCGRQFHGTRALAIHAATCINSSATSAASAAGGTTTSVGFRQCHACKRAITPETLGKHIAAHLQEGFVVCGLCDGKPVASSLDLLQHLEAHTNSMEFPNACVMCHMKLDDSEFALRHLKEEHGLAHLPCPECDMSYTFSQQLARHTEIVHRICLYSKRRYICWICRAYDHVKKETLINHFQIAHGLQRSQVNEKAMIRTRGQGTMPTSQFIPTKQIKKKPTKAESERNVDKVDSNKATAIPTVVTASKVTEETAAQPLTASSLAIDSVVTPVIDNDLENKELTASVVNSSTPVHRIIRVDIKEAFNSANDSNQKIENSFVEASTTENLLTSVNSSMDRTDTSASSASGLSSDIAVVSNDEESVTLSIIGTTTERIPKEPVKEEVATSSPKKKVKTHQCDQCSFATNWLEKIERHKLRHASQKTSSSGYLCTECGQSFVVHQSLVRHMFFVHKIKLQTDCTQKSSEENETIVVDSMVKRKLNQSDTNSSKKLKTEPVDCGKANSGDDDDRANYLKNLPKISTMGVITVGKAVGGSQGESTTSTSKKDEVRPLNSNESKAKSVVTLGHTPLLVPQPFKKLAVVKMEPKSGSLIDTVKNTFGGEGKVLVPKSLVLSSAITHIKPKVSNASSSDKIRQIPARAPIKITNASLLTVFGNKITALAPSKVKSIVTASTTKSSPTASNTVSSNSVRVTTSILSSNKPVPLPNSVTVQKAPTVVELKQGSDSKKLSQSVRSLATPVAIVSQQKSAVPDVTVTSFRVIDTMKEQQERLSKPDVHDGEVLSTSTPVHQCNVCHESFSSSAEQYSHMRSHGMAFLQLGRKRVSPSRVGAGQQSLSDKEDKCVTVEENSL